MKRLRGIFTLSTGVILLAAWHFSRYTSAVFGIRPADFTSYPRMKVHPVFPMLFGCGIALVILGLVLLVADSLKNVDHQKHD